MKKMKQIWLELKGNGLFGKYQSQFLLIFSFGGGGYRAQNWSDEAYFIKNEGGQRPFFFKPQYTQALRQFFY